MNWEPDPDLGKPVAGVSLERRRFQGEDYDYRVVVRVESKKLRRVVAESRHGREAIGEAYHAARRTAELFLGNEWS